VVTTPTASGKTLCYNLPVLDRILKKPSARALYLFPDQGARAGSDGGAARAREINRRSGGEAIGVHTYDGDTPQDARRTIRTRAHIVLSNPDMVHSGILPHHPRWAKLFENLDFIVIDELHAYRGVFGSHLTNVLRPAAAHLPALRIESAVHLLVGDDRQSRRSSPSGSRETFSLVEKSGAPRGEKFFVFVNPPVVNRELGIRRSYIAESRRVAGEFLRRNLQVIVFAQSRLSTEILTTYLKEDFEDVPGMPERIPRLSRRLPAAARRRDREGPCGRARCAAWSRPTRSSSASTSAPSTCA
jgi:DEAD/DEAH box helicase domain-containing protein